MFLLFFRLVSVAEFCFLYSIANFVDIHISVILLLYTHIMYACIIFVRYFY